MYRNSFVQRVEGLLGLYNVGAPTTLIRFLFHCLVFLTFFVFYPVGSEHLTLFFQPRDVYAAVLGTPEEGARSDGGVD